VDEVQPLEQVRQSSLDAADGIPPAQALEINTLSMIVLLRVQARTGVTGAWAIGPQPPYLPPNWSPPISFLPRGPGLLYAGCTQRQPRND
jgi:hypothetical protein